MDREGFLLALIAFCTFQLSYATGSPGWNDIPITRPDNLEKIDFDPSQDTIYMRITPKPGANFDSLRSGSGTSRSTIFIRFFKAIETPYNHHDSEVSIGYITKSESVGHLTSSSRLVFTYAHAYNGNSGSNRRCEKDSTESTNLDLYLTLDFGGVNFISVNGEDYKFTDCGNNGLDIKDAMDITLSDLQFVIMYLYEGSVPEAHNDLFLMQYRTARKVWLTPDGDWTNALAKSSPYSMLEIRLAFSSSSPISYSSDGGLELNVYFNNPIAAYIRLTVSREVDAVLGFEFGLDPDDDSKKCSESFSPAHDTFSYKYNVITIYLAKNIVPEFTFTVTKEETLITKIRELSCDPPIGWENVAVSAELVDVEFSLLHGNKVSVDYALLPQDADCGNSEDVVWYRDECRNCVEVDNYYFDSDTQKCLSCPPGSKAPAGSSNCVCEEGKLLGNTCCALGYELDDESPECVECSAGTYRSSDLDSCQPCPDGTISSGGAGMCSECPDWSRPNSQKSECEFCTGLPPEAAHVVILNGVEFPISADILVGVGCEPGYTLTGSTTAVCISGTEFGFQANPDPVCNIDTCSGLPTDIPHLTTSANFPVNFGQFITVSCDTGYRIAGDTAITCVQGNTFSFKTGVTCERETCIGLPEGSVNLQTATVFPIDYGTTVDVSCDPQSNIELRGDRIITCISGTTFYYEDQPRCNDESVCTNLPTEKNWVTETTFPVARGTVVFVSCAPGHSLAEGDGNNAITCQQDSEFLVTDLGPVCDMDACLELPDVFNLVLREGSTLPVVYGDVVRVSCDTGYSLYGDEEITCVRGNVFTPRDSTTCILDECTGLPTIPHIRTEATFPVAVGSRVKIGCDTGFTFTGSNLITCVKDQEFQIGGEQPFCVTDLCTGPLFEDNLVFDDTTFPIESFTVTPVSCRAPYNLLGDSTVTCEKGKSYTYGQRPVCVNGGGYHTCHSST